MCFQDQIRADVVVMKVGWWGIWDEGGVSIELDVAVVLIVCRKYTYFPSQ